MTVLSTAFYQDEDVLHLSRNLLGKYLLTKIGGKLTGGMIIETEAYRGPEDKASHAFANRRTKRNEAMYQAGGICYVYQCYGLHYLFNVVTNLSEIPHAILIRAIKPEIGIDVMLLRRNKSKVDKTLAGGPGTLSQALGINKSHNGLPLDGPPIWIEDRGVIAKAKEVIAGPRIGVAYAGEHAHLPWRFRLQK